MRLAGGSDPTQGSIEWRLAPLVAAQYGVFSRDQAASKGATKSMMQRRLATGRWDQLYAGVFRIAGTPPSWRQSLLAACLAWGDGAVASHRAAAALWRLAGFEPGPLEVTVPRDRRRSHAGIVAHWLPALSPPDVTSVDSIPVTAAARTLIDVASVAPLNMVEEALDDALRRRLVSLPLLRWRLSELGRGGRPGIGAIRSLLAARGRSGVPESVFETRLLRVLREAGITPPALQHHVREGRRLVAVLDFAFPEARVAIEADGYRWHSGRARWERDLARRNVLTSLGWRVVHVTWTDLTADRAEMVNRIRRVIAGADRDGAGRS